MVLARYTREQKPPTTLNAYTHSSFASLANDRKTTQRMLGLLLVGLAAIFAPAASHGQTLADAVAEMLELYPKIRIQQSRVQIDENKLNLEESSLRPQLSLNMRGGEERFANDRGLDVFGNTGTASLQGKQMLFDGGYVRARIDEARLNLQSSSHSLKRTREDLALELAVAYIEILKSTRLKYLADDNIRLHQEALGKINTKFKSGAGPKADVLLVTGRLAKAQATLESRKRQLKRAQTTFLKLTGHLPGELTEPDFPEWAMPQSLDEVDFANSPRVKAAQADLGASMSSKRLAQSANKPQLNFIIEGDISDSERYQTPQEDAMALITLSYNIFDGGKRRADVGRADSRILESEWKLKDAILEVETSFANAWNELISIEERMYLLDTHREAMESVVEAYHEQFELGKRPLINLLDVENELFGAKSTLEEERFSRLQAAYRLLSSTGELIPSLQ